MKLIISSIFQNLVTLSEFQITSYFATLYFKKVNKTHNLRLLNQSKYRSV